MHVAILEDRTRGWKAAHRLGFCGRQQVVVMGVRRDVTAAESEGVGGSPTGKANSSRRAGRNTAQHGGAGLFSVGQIALQPPEFSRAPLWILHT